MTHLLSRRDLLLATGTAALTAVATRAATAADTKPTRPADEPFGYCFNTSTIRGQGLDLVTEIEIAAKAGFTAIEPWVREIDGYVDKGGSLKDLGKRLQDHGLTVESAIGFAEWLVDDDERRRKGLEQAKRDMDRIAQIGGKRLAAPPAGATNQDGLPLDTAAERYRTLLEAGLSLGVVAQVEVWGFSKVLSRLADTAYVAVASGNPRALILPDVYHLYKGGSGFGGLALLSGTAIQVIHLNDYPADPPRDKITDAERVFPGDGAAPLGDIFRALRDGGFRGHLSLELFNRDYWKRDPFDVARTGLEKTRAAVRKALG